MNSFSFRCASWPSSLSQSPKMQHGKITVIQAFIIREVITLLLRFTSFASRFTNPEEYDIFRFSKSPARLLTWQLGQTPDLKSVGKCQNPHPGRALPINFQQVAWPPHPTPPHPTPILGQTIGRCIYQAVSLTKRRWRGVEWEGPFRREKRSAKGLAISARPLISISPLLSNLPSGRKTCFLQHC